MSLTQDRHLLSIPGFCICIHAKLSNRIQNIVPVEHVAYSCCLMDLYNKLQEIAELKLPDLNCNNVEAAMRIVEGTAKNMGVTVEQLVTA